MSTTPLEYASPAAADTRLRKGTLQYTKATLVLLFTYLLWGDFVFQLMETVIPQLMPLQLDAWGASPKVIGWLTATLPPLLNLLVNPVVSFRSDNYRSRWGRRIPFLVVATPFISLVLVTMAFAPEIGQYLHTATWFRSLSPNSVIIGTVAVLLVAFHFLNMIVSPIYYYLFVDVVPDAYMARFLALFRIVINIKAALFNWFLFGHWKEWSREIYIGCALLYALGFLWMCTMVKEGEYPPPAHGKRLGLIGSIKIYCKECYSHWHYLLFNFTNTTRIVAGATNFAAIFVLTKELALSADYIGKVQAVTAMISLLLLYPAAALSDKINPVRMFALAMLVTLPISLLNFFFLQGSMSYTVLAMIALPANTILSASEMPFYAMIPPRERYGQFGSANQIIINLSTIVVSFAVASPFMDWVTDGGKNVANYRYLYLWSFVWQCLAILFMFLLYRSWRRYGGPNNYVPPLARGVGSEECGELAVAHVSDGAKK